METKLHNHLIVVMTIFRKTRKNVYFTSQNVYTENLYILAIQLLDKERTSYSVH